MRTPATTSTERECTFPLVCQRGLVFIRTLMHRDSSSMFAPSRHLHVHGHPCVLFTLILPFYFLLYLPLLLFLFLNYLKSVVNLHNSCNESMDSTDEFSLSTGYEPKAHDFYETSVEPYVQLLDSPPLFSDKAPTADPDYDDATLEDMLHQVHRAQVYHSLREYLSVSLSSSMSDRTGLLEIDRGDPVSTETQKHRLGLCSTMKKEQILAECQARINQHEFQADRAEEDQRFLQGQLLQQNLELREAHNRSLTEMEELKEVSEFCIRHYCKTKISRGSEHYIGTFWPNRGIAK